MQHIYFNLHYILETKAGLRIVGKMKYQNRYAFLVEKEAKDHVRIMRYEIKEVKEVYVSAEEIHSVRKGSRLSVFTTPIKFVQSPI